MPEEKRQQEGGNVVSVRVGVGQDDDPFIPQPAEVEGFPEAAP